ncbi:MAG: ATP-binding cassette domain-containing protein [Armatimonadia bacterium]|nr:ATP-binding cassette domain-containing protein [Armatimonadia bacterium]
MPLLEVQGGRWGYRSGEGFFYPARAIDFNVAAGEIVMLTGANGCGKTTILRGLLGRAAAEQGSVSWTVTRGEVGYVPQESGIDHSIPASVMDIVRTGDPARWGRNGSEAAGALAAVGMQGHGEAAFSRLSGGQRRRVLIARALIGNPRLLLLDEPTINVDAPGARRVGELLQDLAAAGLGILATSHVSGWVAVSRRVPVIPAGERA